MKKLRNSESGGGSATLIKYSSISNWLYVGETKFQATTTISQIGNYSQWKMILKLNSFWLAWMFYKCRITKYIVK